MAKRKTKRLGSLSTDSITRRFTASVAAARRSLNRGHCGAALVELGHANYIRGQRDAAIARTMTPERTNWKLTMGVLMNLNDDFMHKCGKRK